MIELFNKVIKWFKNYSYRRIDAYLSDSIDISDLERRLKTLEREGRL